VIVVTSKNKEDFPLPIAIMLFAIIAGGYFYLNILRFHPGSIIVLKQFCEHYSNGIGFSVIALITNITFIGSYLKRTFGLSKQGSKLAALQGKKVRKGITKTDLTLFFIGVVCFMQTRKTIHPILGPVFSPMMSLVGSQWLAISLSMNLAVFVFFALKLLLQIFEKFDFVKSRNKNLETPSTEEGELVLGTTMGELYSDAQNIDSQKNSGFQESWVKIPRRGVNGGIFITGSVGSGKSQGTILPYLKQIVANKDKCPALLAIDPKGTFLREAETIFNEAGVSDRIVRITLKGDQTFNPVFANDCLKNSRFVELAEMVRAASINFMGKSSDSPFWSVSSTNLIRNAIVYCAATIGYFTLLDLYKSIVEAANLNIVENLKAILNKKEFTQEERFNIERCIDYFENEYLQMDNRLRTSIVATGTAFINQFQEYHASRIFCPKKEDLTLTSMEQLILDGNILLFDIQQPGLARSMGTIIKLHFEQAVLNLLPELKQKNQPWTTALIIDEYQDVVTCGGGGTIGDDSFLAKARESKPAVIVATQSLSSLMNTVGSSRPALELVQNFRTRIACHSSDIETIKMYQELAGKKDTESEVRSLSETSQSAKLNLIAGGFESENSNLNESVSFSKRREDLISGQEFSRLRTFEAFAQVFDGVNTKFVKLHLKPSFLKKVNVKHDDVLEMIKQPEGKQKSVSLLKTLFKHVLCILMSFISVKKAIADSGVPTVCSVASTPSYESCLDLQIKGCTCGFPPHPCALISYYVPQSFIEVWPDPRMTYFSILPGVRLQMKSATPGIYGAEADDDTQSYHAHALSIPFASMIFSSMPAHGTRMEKYCFDAMSEHFGTHWRTGKSDLTQPFFLAWSLAPKACLLKGAATSVTGEPGGAPRGDSFICSFKVPKVNMFPPSSHDACNGWGTFYPRYGSYAGPAGMTGALMIGSRIKSLAAEVLSSMPNSPDEKWQMIYPQASSCFREGQNIGILETIKGAREERRLINGKLKGYLFAVWSRASTCQEYTSVIQAQAAAASIGLVCRGAP
jgi:hypothetical protein